MEIISRLDLQYLKYQDEYEEAVLKVLRKGHYVLGSEVSQFEDEFASYVGSPYCVGLANGLDALILGFRALGITTGDEVIVQANTYIASVMGITLNGATPIFVEPNTFYNLDDRELESKITSKTKAILVVHLYGQATKMDSILHLCKKHNLYLVEDCAQSHGANYKNQRTGSFGDVACFSFYPSKNLGAFGDGGAITTPHESIAQKIRVLRNYGSQKRYENEVVGVNSRLDEIQAALLRIKLSHLDELTQERVELAHYYTHALAGLSLELPKVDKDCSSVWHQYVVRTPLRDELKAFLENKGIHTLIHYPIPPHLSQAYESLGYTIGDFPVTERIAQSVLSLPLYNGMTRLEQDYVVETIKAFYQEIP